MSWSISIFAKDRVRIYYAQLGEREWNCLLSPRGGADEFEVNRKAITRYLAERRILAI